MTAFSLPTVNGTKQIQTVVSKPLFIVGRNGTGKSAMMNSLRATAGRKAVYLPGSRTSVFDGEGINLTTFARKQLESNLFGWDSSPETRWRIISGNQRNEKAVHDLTAAETQYKIDAANAIAAGVSVGEAVLKLQSQNSPLNQVNLILEESNIPVRLIMSEAELKATQNGQIYSFARMSDGERTALIIISEVIAAKKDSVFFIDEPELHMHRAIVVPLISQLVKLRSDCEFVISTHELGLPSSVEDAQVCILRSAEWDQNGNVRAWDFDVVPSTDALPDELQTEILGSRRRVVFTEGTDASMDIPMYSILFPKASAIPRGGCREVQRAVAGLRATRSMHQTEAFGLVDNDGMSPETIAKFMEEGVYPLPVFSVESLYYAREVVEAVATRQAATMAAEYEKQLNLANEYVSTALAAGIAAARVSGVLEALASRLAERQVRDTLLGQLPGRDELKNTTLTNISISLISPYHAELARIQALVANLDLFGLIARYPVRHSGVLKAVATSLRFQTRLDYETAALARVSADTELRAKLLKKLDPLSEAVNA